MSEENISKLFYGQKHTFGPHMFGVFSFWSLSFSTYFRFDPYRYLSDRFDDAANRMLMCH
jgi:hypothetical protein